MRSVAFSSICVLALSFSAHTAEEKIRGVLEKTAKLDACAQITDALNEIYYVAKTDEAEKMVANFVGKSQKVVLSGTIETKPNETASYINLKSVELYVPRMPPVPAPVAPTPVAPEKKDEPKK